MRGKVREKESERGIKSERERERERDVCKSFCKSTHYKWTLFLKMIVYFVLGCERVKKWEPSSVEGEPRKVRRSSFT